MNAKIVWPCSLALALLGSGAARAQDYSPPRGELEGARPSAQNYGEPPPPVTPAPPAHGSEWITYQRPDCCVPFGGDPPFSGELFFRMGVSIPIAGDVFDETLQTGWVIEGGGRAYFFNRRMDAAWTLSLGLMNIHNNGQNPNFVAFNQLFPATEITVFVDDQQPAVMPIDPLNIGVGVRSLNRTFVNLGLGREWFWNASAVAPGPKWRFGIDGGWRYGTSKLEVLRLTALPPPREDLDPETGELLATTFTVLDQFPSKTDVIHGAWVSLHSDIEVPWGCCTLLAGFRWEWDYTATDLIVDGDGDVQSMNLLINAGVRY
jgi:hypothetical protein